MVRVNGIGEYVHPTLLVQYPATLHTGSGWKTATRPHRHRYRIWLATRSHLHQARSLHAFQGVVQFRRQSLPIQKLAHLRKMRWFESAAQQQPRLALLCALEAGTHRGDLLLDDLRAHQIRQSLAGLAGDQLPQPVPVDGRVRQV